MNPYTADQTEALLATLRAILTQPTAPFREDAVRREIMKQLGELPSVTVEQDAFGNVLTHYSRGPADARFVFAAHMDHPGFVRGEFLGGVPEEYRASNPPVRDFGDFAMWDLPAFEVREGRVYSRACDDLVGCAVIVAMFQELAGSGAECSVHGIFTRAEEVGFIGAIHLARSSRLPRSLTIVSLETSSERGGACTMGAGVIVRVGDRTSIFDSEATAMLIDLAQHSGIPHQRALMSGGTCEATAYQLYGYRAAGLCVALGNYHNCGPHLQISAEYVAVTDVAAMTQLCVAGALLPSDAPSPENALRERLERGLEKYSRFD